jgi:hypothetical protein
MSQVDPVIGYVAFRRSDLRKFFVLAVVANIVAKPLYNFLKDVSKDVSIDHNNLWIKKGQ